MPFRSQEFFEHCGSCDVVARGACPRCRAMVCETHSCDPHGCCEACATEMYFAVSRAGKRHILGGSVVAFISWSSLYMVYALRLSPPIAIATLVAGVVAGFGAILWGGSVSPRLAERALLRSGPRPADRLRALEISPERYRLAAAPATGDSPPLG